MCTVQWGATTARSGPAATARSRAAAASAPSPAHRVAKAQQLFSCTAAAPRAALRQLYTCTRGATAWAHGVTTWGTWGYGLGHMWLQRVHVRLQPGAHGVTAWGTWGYSLGHMGLRPGHMWLQRVHIGLQGVPRPLQTASSAPAPTASPRRTAASASSPARSMVIRQVESATLEAARSSTRGGGWGPSGWASLWEYRAAQSRQARPEEAQGASWGTAKGSL